MTEGPCLIEYVGTKKGALAMPPPSGKSGSLKFNLSPAYENRRVEEFPSAKAGEDFMRQFNSGGKTRFERPHDLIHAGTVVAIAAAVERSDAFQNLQKQVNDLMETVAKLSPPKAKTKAKAKATKG